MLFGEHAVVYGKPCIVTAVDERIRVFLSRTADAFLTIEAPGVELLGHRKKITDIGRNGGSPKGARFIEATVNNFFRKFKVNSGLRIETSSDFSSEFGFGSSSAVTVATAKALSEIFAVKMTNQQIFDVSYQAVLDVQGVGSGFDLAAAIWGKTIYFVKGARKVSTIRVENLPLVVGYTGIKADTPTIVKDVAKFKSDHERVVNSIFTAISGLVDDATEAFKQKDYQTLGKLANINQGLLDSLGVNTPKLQALIFAAREAGAYGAKLSGAGGGDCMIAFVSRKDRKAIEKAIEESGGKILRVKTNTEGVRVER